MIHPPFFSRARVGSIGDQICIPLIMISCVSSLVIAMKIESDTSGVLTVSRDLMIHKIRD